MERSNGRPDSVPTSSALEAFKLPGAASLHEQLDKLVLLCLRDGRNFIGWLRSFDQYANLILDNTVERLTFEDKYCDVSIGMFIIRGENVMLLGEIDEEKELEISKTMTEVSEKEIREAIAKDDADPKSNLRKERAEWPIPEEV